MASFSALDVFAMSATPADRAPSSHARLRYRVGAWHAHPIRAACPMD
ncbi:hypothetical protein [Pandoraea bronchicola]|nr:hypothetical protein [Pandoraea bronchicola]